MLLLVLIWLVAVGDGGTPIALVLLLLLTPAGVDDWLHMLLLLWLLLLVLVQEASRGAKCEAEKQDKLRCSMAVLLACASELVGVGVGVRAEAAQKACCVSCGCDEVWISAIDRTTITTQGRASKSKSCQPKTCSDAQIITPCAEQLSNLSRSGWPLNNAITSISSTPLFKSLSTSKMLCNRSIATQRPFSSARPVACRAKLSVRCSASPSEGSARRDVLLAGEEQGQQKCEDQICCCFAPRSGSHRLCTACELLPILLPYTLLRPGGLGRSGRDTPDTWLTVENSRPRALHSLTLSIALICMCVCLHNNRQVQQLLWPQSLSQLGPLPLR